MDAAASSEYTVGTPLHIFDLPEDVLGAILSAELIGMLGCAIVAQTCVKFNEIVHRPFDANFRSVNICREAIIGGHLSILEWARDHYSVETFACSLAAEHGQLDVIQYLHSRGHWVGQTICNQAAEYGHLHILKWTVEKGYLGCTKKNVRSSCSRMSYRCA